MFPKHPNSTHSVSAPKSPTPQGNTSTVRSVHDEIGNTVERQVGRYHIEALIARGATGLVFLAQDTQLNRKVALKFLHPSRLQVVTEANSGDKSAAEQADILRSEAVALARLNHPSVVEVYEMGVHEGQSFVAMEFVDGVPLNEWLKEPRSYRDRVDILLQVGTALSVAHQKHLVHRDIKPSNVLVDKGNQARLVDFGLACSPGTSVPGDATSFKQAGSITSIAGTPEYMAPEIVDGGPATHLSDQYSFCVMAMAALQPKAPPRLQQVINRGLQKDPAQRFESVASLCAAIERSLVRPKWPQLLAVSIACVAVAYFGANALADDEETCSLRTDRLAEVWNPSIKRALTNSLQEIPRPYARDTAERVVALLDERGKQWLGLQQETCLASQSGKQSPDQLDRRMACFHRQLEETAEQIQLLVDAPTVSILDSAVEAITAVLSPTECRYDTGTSHPTKQASDSLQKLVHRAKSLHRAGSYLEAVSVAEEAVDQARSEKATSQLAQAALILSKTQAALQNFDLALQALDEASKAAVELGDNLLIVNIWTQRIVQEGILKNNHKAGDVWSTATEEKLQLLDNPSPRLRAEVLGTIGRFHAWASHDTKAKHYYDRAIETTKALSDGNALLRAELLTNAANFWLVQRSDLERIVGTFRQSLAIQRQLLGDGHPKAAKAQSMMALALLEQGNASEARRLQEDALNRLLTTYGPDEPILVQHHFDLSQTLLVMGQMKDAIFHIERCLEILRSHPDPALLPRVYFTHGRILRRMGRVREAHESLTKAVELTKKEFSPTHRGLTAHLVSLGIVRRQLGDLEQAKAAFQEALDIHKVNDMNPQVAVVIWHNLGEVLVEEGRCDEAASHFQKTLDVITKEDPEHPNRAYPLLALGKCALTAERSQEAITHLEEALRVRRTAKLDPLESAEMQFVLGQARWQAGQRKAGRKLVKEVDKMLARVEAPAAHRAEVRRWLRAHPR